MKKTKRRPDGTDSVPRHQMIARILVVALLLTASWRDAGAWAAYSEVAYNSGTNALNSFSTTYKTSGDPTYGELCIDIQYWGETPYCAQYIALGYQVKVNAWLMKPPSNTVHAAGQDLDGAQAIVSNQVNNPVRGLWRRQADHFFHVTMYGCTWYWITYGWGNYACSELSQYDIYLGNTFHELVLPCYSGANNTAFLDPAAVAEAFSFPMGEPFERGATLRCIAPSLTSVVVEYRNDSFGTFDLVPGWGDSGVGYTNDPCKSFTAGINSLTAAVHSHPFFQAPEEYVREKGCHGDKIWPSQAHLNNVNSDNNQISQGDKDAYDCVDSPSYVRFSSASILKRRIGAVGTCLASEAQVYP